MRNVVSMRRRRTRDEPDEVRDCQAAPTSQVIPGCSADADVRREGHIMTDDLRGRLNAMATTELVAILQGRDLNEWRPEVFPLVDAILKERGENPARWQAYVSHPPGRNRGTVTPQWARGGRIMLVGLAMAVALLEVLGGP